MPSSRLDRRLVFASHTPAAGTSGRDEDESISLANWLSRLRAGRQQVMPDDHSAVEPRLPIPNRTVKRCSADDSEQLACESRTSSGSYLVKGPPSGGPFLLCVAPVSPGQGEALRLGCRKALRSNGSGIAAISSAV